MSTKRALEESDESGEHEWIKKHKNMKWKDLDPNNNPSSENQPLSNADIDYLKDKQDIDFIAHIGNGTIGVIWSARVKEFNGAVKIIPLKSYDHLSEMSEAAKRVLSESEIMKKLDHQHIVNAKHVLHVGENKDPNLSAQPLLHTLIFMELFDQSMLQLNESRGPFTERTCLKWFQQIADALRYLHTQVMIAHNDMHLGNILVKFLDVSETEAVVKILVKLADFGIAIDRNTDINNNYNNALQSDVYNLSYCLECCALDDNNQMSLEEQTNTGIDVSVISGNLNLSEDFIDLFMNTSNSNENQRFNISQVWNHRWLNSEPYIAGQYFDLN